MTLANHTQKRSLSRSHPEKGELILCFCSLFCLLLLLRNTEATSTFMTHGLAVCAGVVIPSLFPFTVLSELILSGRFFRRLLCRLASPLCHLLGLSDDGICAVLLGMLCGFPIGPRCAVHAYQSGRISRDEAERVIAFSGPPSSAFLIGAVGTSLFEDRSFGILLYACVLLSALLTGILLNLLRPKNVTPFFALSPSVDGHATVAKRLTAAVASATQSMLLVCAYVVFFSTIVGALGLILEPFGLPEPLSAFLHALFELSGGTARAAALSSPRAARILAAFAAGWSGLSVHCQTRSFCDGTDLTLSLYLPAKLMQAGFTTAMIAILFR